MVTDLLKIVKSYLILQDVFSCLPESVRKEDARDKGPVRTSLALARIASECSSVGSKQRKTARSYSISR